MSGCATCKQEGRHQLHQQICRYNAEYHSSTLFVRLTCMTALQNSRELRNWTRAGTRSQSSLCRQCHSSLGTSSLVGRDEYRPLSPVASTCTGAKFRHQLYEIRPLRSYTSLLISNLCDCGSKYLRVLQSQHRRFNLK